MPFFFIANAYFIRNYKISEHIRKSFHSLVIPYAIVCIISAVLDVDQNAGTIPNYQVFLDRIADMLLGMSKISTYFNSFQSVWLMWFVICLFISRILYVTIMSHLTQFSYLLQITFLLLLASVGMVVGTRIAYLPWSLDVALAVLPFMWFGDYLHKSGVLNKLNFKLMCIATIIWGILGISGIQIELATRAYPGFLLSHMAAIAGSIFVIGVSQIIDAKGYIFKSFFAWCGNNSMIILSIHCLDMRFFHWEAEISSYIPAPNYIFIFVIQYILTLSLSWVIVQIRNFIIYLNSLPCQITK